MGRKTKEELKEITKKYDVNRLWSWSKFNTYHNSPYEYYLKYIIKKPENQKIDKIVFIQQPVVWLMTLWRVYTQAKLNMKIWIQILKMHGLPLILQS